MQVSESLCWLHLCPKDTLEKLSSWILCFNPDITTLALFVRGLEKSEYYVVNPDSLSYYSRDTEQSASLSKDICEPQKQILLVLSDLMIFFFPRCISINKRNCKQNVVQWVYNHWVGCGWDFFLVSRRAVLQLNCMCMVFGLHYPWVIDYEALVDKAKTDGS